MTNLNMAYRKGPFRDIDRGGSVTRFQQKWINKRWRKTAKKLNEIEEEVSYTPKRKKSKKHIKVKITTRFYGDNTWTQTNKYRNLRDAQNAMHRANVIRAEIIE